MQSVLRKIELERLERQLEKNFNRDQKLKEAAKLRRRSYILRSERHKASLVALVCRTVSGVGNV